MMKAAANMAGDVSMDSSRDGDSRGGVDGDGADSDTTDDGRIGNARLAGIGGGGGGGDVAGGGGGGGLGAKNDNVDSALEGIHKDTSVIIWDDPEGRKEKKRLMELVRKSSAVVLPQPQPHPLRSMDSKKVDTLLKPELHPMESSPKRARRSSSLATGGVPRVMITGISNKDEKQKIGDKIKSMKWILLVAE